MSRLNHFLTVRAVLLGIAALLAVLGVGNAFVAIFMPARYEVVYDFDVTVAHCTRGRCAYSALLSVANSGRRAQEEVTLTISGLPEGLGGQPRILSLDASIARGPDPAIERERAGQALRIRLKGFTPGTLLQLPFSGYFQESALPGALEPDVSVDARGRVIRGDPRTVAFGRWFADGSRPAPASVADGAGARQPV